MRKNIFAVLVGNKPRHVRYRASCWNPTPSSSDTPSLKHLYCCAMA